MSRFATCLLSTLLTLALPVFAESPPATGRELLFTSADYDSGQVRLSVANDGQAEAQWSPKAKRNSAAPTKAWKHQLKLRPSRTDSLFLTLDAIGFNKLKSSSSSNSEASFTLKLLQSGRLVHSVHIMNSAASEEVLRVTRQLDGIYKEVKESAPLP